MILLWGCLHIPSFLMASCSHAIFPLIYYILLECDYRSKDYLLLLSIELKLPTCILQECLFGYLASKTVVYVTHHVEFLPSADAILVSWQQMPGILCYTQRMFLVSIPFLHLSGSAKWKNNTVRGLCRNS
jgi:hypothetical protein